VHTVRTDGVQHQHSIWKAVDTRFSTVF
jgi:hypothetical protein